MKYKLLGNSGLRVSEYALGTMTFGDDWGWGAAKDESQQVYKALIDTTSDRILGFSVFGVGAGEIMASVQVAMLAGLPYTALRDAIFTHPTMAEGLIPFFASVPPAIAAELRRAA